MAAVAPFRALRYDPAAVGDLARVVCPPYDVISERARARLEGSSPYNSVRLVLPRDEAGGDRYTAARALLEAWTAAGILRADEEESLTLYEMRWEGRVTRGVLAAVSLGEGVLPHERTYDDIVADRLALLRATECNLDCVFCVYEGEEGAARDALDVAATHEPLARFTTGDGIEHVLWRIEEARAVSAALEKATMVIADGHHRWRTAQTYREERRATEGAGPWDAQLAWLVDAGRNGPGLLPIHRTLAGIDDGDLLARLRGAFDVEPAQGDPERLAGELVARRAHGRCFAMIGAGGAWWLTVRDAAAERDALPRDRSAAWRDLDVAVLQSLVFERLLGAVTPGFVHSATEAADAVASRRASVAFLLAPVPFPSVRAVAVAGEAMPQKSTYFVPKPKTGVVMRPLGSSGFHDRGDIV